MGEGSSYGLRASGSYSTDRLLRGVDIGVATTQPKDLAGGQEGLGGPVGHWLGKGLGGNCDEGRDREPLHVGINVALFCFVSLVDVVCFARCLARGIWGSLGLYIG